MVTTRKGPDPHLVDIPVGAAADPLDELIVVLRVPAADVGRHDGGRGGSGHLMSRAADSGSHHITASHHGLGHWGWRHHHPLLHQELSVTSALSSLKCYKNSVSTFVTIT